MFDEIENILENKHLYCLATLMYCWCIILLKLFFFCYNS